MTNSILISGKLDQGRLAGVLGELAEMSSRDAPPRRAVLVIDSDGGAVDALCGFLECIFEGNRTRLLVEGAAVKIYGRATLLPPAAA